MKHPRAHIAFAAAAAMMLAGCQTFTLAEAGKPVEIANAFTVTPARNWNRLSQDKVETWTLDGPVLQQVQFFKGIESGKPMIEALSADQNKKAPEFESRMTPLEIRDLFVTTRARANNITLTTSGLRPEPFADSDGFRFEYSYTDANGVAKKGFVKATTRNERLFLIDYSAVALFYYERDLPIVERLLDSLRATSA